MASITPYGMICAIMFISSNEKYGASNPATLKLLLSHKSNFQDLKTSDLFLGPLKTEKKY